MMTNMVALARQKSELLEPSLLKLSDLLRYMLYDANKDRFLLSQEISYLRSYIELQQLRFGEGLDLVLDIEEPEPDFYMSPCCYCLLWKMLSNTESAWYPIPL